MFNVCVLFFCLFFLFILVICNHFPHGGFFVVAISYVLNCKVILPTKAGLLGNRELQLGPYKLWKNYRQV